MIKVELTLNNTDPCIRSSGMKKVTLLQDENQVSSFRVHDEALLCYENNGNDDEFHFIGSTLQLREIFILVQPLVDVLEAFSSLTILPDTIFCYY